jgi:hypothetical protein
MDSKTWLIFDSDVAKLRLKVNRLQVALGYTDDGKTFREEIAGALDQLVTTLEHFSTLDRA